MLMVYPIIRWFAQRLIENQSYNLEREASVFLAGCRAVDQMLLIKHGYSRNYRLLQDLLVARWKLTSTVYSKAELIPKDHYSLHLCDHYFRAGEDEEEHKWMDCEDEEEHK